MINKFVNKPEPPLCSQLLRKLGKVTENGVAAKQVVALGFLSGALDKELSAKKLTAGGARRLSTFMSYFILKAIAESKDVSSALDIMKAYYSGMISRGATTFWEDFDVEWLENSGRIDEFTPIGKKELHGDYGKFCYKGFRYSLCHGWPCDPIQFLTENVLGGRVIDSGCKLISIRPQLGELEWCKGVFPTPFGEVKIYHRKVAGEVLTTVNAPQGVQVQIEA